MVARDDHGIRYCPQGGDTSLQSLQGLPGCGEQRKGGTWEASAAQPRQLCCNSASGSFCFPVSVSPPRVSEGLEFLDEVLC